ncbi:hypothetical protein [Acidovorax sp. K2F]|uniref:hypothetical protein n=1 Tax=Acidovorax sp. K2F TaxID=2978125 RepID=UPI0021B0DD40|nr:hypothetical protein [Acidovorax sp. K2F]MCT6717035.1 hypothetical protein [Acidovorax sp. K2F]
MKLLTQRFEALHLTVVGAHQQPGKPPKMDWVPIVFIVFKVAVFGTGMFFAIKWHYDQGKKEKEEASRSQMPTERSPGTLE